jgi:hypothetical protein
MDEKPLQIGRFFQSGQYLVFDSGPSLFLSLGGFR